MGVMQIVTGLCGLLAIGLLFMLWRNRQEMKALRQSHEEQLQQLQQQLDLVNRGAIGVGRRLIDVEKAVNSALDKQSDLATRDHGYVPYSQAIQLLDQGADVEQIIEQCGLSRAEAVLMELIHNPAKSP